MQLGLVGLGRMGAGMAGRLRGAGHEVIGYDVNPDVSQVASIADLAARLRPPRHVWVMVPHGGPTDDAVAALADALEPGDLVVEGGNSRWTDDGPRAATLAERGIGYVDCGVSGGVWGPEYGYALMVGGAPADVERLMPVFDALKPPGSAGFVHAGPVGAGHFAKMVHNGIEYGLMQSYAEGFELLQAADLIEDVPGVVDSWTEGTVIRSWLLDLAAKALRDDADLSRLEGCADDSGAGRWTIEAGVAHAVPTPAISAALYARFASRQDDSPAMKLVAALRREFGGHAVSERLAGGAGQADEPVPGATPPPVEPPGQ
jgi:6-phosphogluconate dehydrogenase